MSIKRKFRVLITFVVTGLAFFSGLAVAADPGVIPTPESKATTISANSVHLLTEANSWYLQRDTDGAVAKAIELYSKILSQDPHNYEALWRLARSYWWQGDHASKNQGELFDSGKAAAERAIQASPNSVEGHFWYGVCLGRASQVHGILKSLMSVNAIRGSMETALKINPQYHGAMHVLGVLYRQAPGWPLSSGNMDKSLSYARLAVQTAPMVVLDHIGLAETLLAKGQKKEAIKILEEALTLPGPWDQQPETKEDKQTARRLLEKLR